MVAFILVVRGASTDTLLAHQVTSERGLTYEGVLKRFGAFLTLPPRDSIAADHTTRESKDLFVVKGQVRTTRRCTVWSGELFATSICCISHPHPIGTFLEVFALSVSRHSKA